ncbi:retrotransposon-derived protein PEG10 isoform X1 [Myxocyprinus asiaticus]|uniref:retrotransposon-derived protein PEG10 isoform X1 n=1 Tax=Myxocyprinus asiaticus TaxID=70543 RepID=UPI00222354EA|nr:retrotransposon-derived protein PEG10 isoform X1 [Myxocyprinus asiaticus]
MQIGRTRLSRRESQRHMSKELCLHCAGPGHVIANCPVKAPHSSVDKELLASATPLSKNPTQRPVLPAWLQHRSTIHSVSTLVDSEVEGNFLDAAMASRWQILVVKLAEPITAYSHSGSPLTIVTHSKEPLTLITGNHTGQLSFLLVRSPSAAVVLGHPCLVCLFRDLSDVPLAYHDLGVVFSQSHATTLPPHHPYNCASDLHPGTSPRDRLYSLSAPEREAMNKFITDSLTAGLIRHSSSPAVAGFFFVEKKDGSLRPCIDYQELNDITVKNRYPLQLMTSAFELLQGASVFTKLDLHNAYHLIWIRMGDEWKTAFNTHRGHFEYSVMPFGLVSAPPSSRGS